jgi:hypothetical protein
MWKLICASLLCSLMALSAAQAQAQPDEQKKVDAQAYAAYEAAGDLGAEIFAESLKHDRPLVRVVAVLEACDQMGLANAVREKDTDRKFDVEISKMVSEGRFKDLPFSVLLSAQAVANGLRAGYEIGYREATQLAHSNPAYKANVCAAAVKGADRLLK